MSSRGLLGALLGVAGELPPSVEESLLSDCWGGCFALLFASSNNASLRELPTGLIIIMCAYQWSLGHTFSMLWSTKWHRALFEL